MLGDGNVSTEPGVSPSYVLQGGAPQAVRKPTLVLSCSLSQGGGGSFGATSSILRNIHSLG
jgi:hypothetical protein